MPYRFLHNCTSTLAQKPICARVLVQNICTSQDNPSLFHTYAAGTLSANKQPEPQEVQRRPPRLDPKSSSKRPRSGVPRGRPGSLVGPGGVSLLKTISSDPALYGSSHSLCRGSRGKSGGESSPASGAQAGYSRPRPGGGSFLPPPTEADRGNNAPTGRPPCSGLPELSFASQKTEAGNNASPVLWQTRGRHGKGLLHTQPATFPLQFGRAGLLSTDRMQKRAVPPLQTAPSSLYVAPPRH